MKERLKMLRRQKNTGAAMITLLCAAAVFLGLAAALVYSASVLAASANRQLEHERCYQLAKSFSEVLETDLCAATPPPETSKSVYNYANRFLDDIYNLYDPDNIKNTTYSYSTTIAEDKTRQEYGTVTVTLYKEESAEDADEIKNIRRDFSIENGVTSSAVAEELKKFEESRLNDYRFAMQVTATTANDSYTYVRRYYRMVQYEVQYLYNGSRIYYRAQDGTGKWYVTEGGSQLVSFPEGTATITGSYDTVHVRARSFLQEGE